MHMSDFLFLQWLRRGSARISHQMTRIIAALHFLTFSIGFRRYDPHFNIFSPFQLLHWQLRDSHRSWSAQQARLLVKTPMFPKYQILCMSIYWLQIYINRRLRNYYFPFITYRYVQSASGQLPTELSSADILVYFLFCTDTVGNELAALTQLIYLCARS